MTPTDFRETLYTVDKEGRRKWVYANIVKGDIYRLRLIVVYCLMAFYLIMPWLLIGEEQAIRIDIPARRFVFFGEIFWATDTGFLVNVLAILGISLFFFTALVGRAWCGWACPETVFLEFLFRPIERAIEGNGASRLRLDMQPWNREKILKKGLKYFIYIVCAWIIASTFLAYFLGRSELLGMMERAPWENPVPFLTTVAMMFVMLFQFGWFREQFCTVLCPYARFQSVMMDTNSITVGYDSDRGEPRGKARRAGHNKVGDCVDCGLCVKVCPTGIDIRNGLQLECISCANCIDACNSVMAKLGRPKGLIRYDTENGLTGNRTRVIRPRIFVYAGILLLLVSVMIFRLSHRSLLDAQILRGASDAPYSTGADGRIVNHLHLHLGNKGKTQDEVRVSVINEPNVEVVMPVSPFPVPAESVITAPLFLHFPQSILSNGKRKLTIRVEAKDAPAREQQVTILGPG